MRYAPGGRSLRSLRGHLARGRTTRWRTSRARGRVDARPPFGLLPRRRHPRRALPPYVADPQPRPVIAYLKPPPTNVPRRSSSRSRTRPPRPAPPPEGRALQTLRPRPPARAEGPDRLPP